MNVTYKIKFCDKIMIEVKKLNENNKKKGNSNNNSFIELLLVIIIAILIIFGYNYYKERQEKIKERKEAIIKAIVFITKPSRCG